ncbi:hypothetical protein GXN76_00230 [Kroppenstedtia pulmonis]|uniref:Uncharacterized protein n=1 Tax=Kroppenstedtia pulmonis TaxID=1380685 RepID=A0A7D3XNP8_9BACL|nr:hypothetical protein [Kroppenstedtia pulmonis]QKG83042.1 hypothetical protein GXN76_00230 [Kroppenstedtia pulmonis]
MNLSLRKRIFIPALFFFIVSMPLLVEYGLEKIYSQSISSRYQILKEYDRFLQDPAFDDPFQDKPVYRFGKNTVQFQVDRLRPEVLTDSGGTYQRLGDIVVLLNGNEIDRLPNRILRDANPNSLSTADSVYDDRSIGGDVDTFVLKNHVTNQKKLMIVENISQGKLEKTPDGYNYYYPGGLEESQQFRVFTIESDGTYHKEEFGYLSERTYLQTHLAQRVSEIAFGQYADWMYAWPTYFFPYFYPFGTGLLGILLFTFSFRKRESK